jgi:hypothetical protein
MRDTVILHLLQIFTGNWCLLNGISIVTFIFPFTVIKFMCLFSEVHFAPWSHYCVVLYYKVFVSQHQHNFLLCFIIWISQLYVLTASWSSSGHYNVAHLRQRCHNSKFVIFQERVLRFWSATTTQLLSSGEFCKLRYDTMPVKSASANVSIYTSNSKMLNFEL